jgi:AcrR family transcriptional regulator
MAGAVTQEGTKKRILDAAERLFAEHGYHGTSLRNIITDANVNLAAVNYHFSSKEGLLDAVVARRAEPVNAERIAMLEACEREACGAPSLEGVLEAFLAPPFRLSQDPHRGLTLFPRVMARLHSEGGELTRKIFQRHFGQVLARFTGAVHAALPELPRTELLWRWHFAIGAMVHAISTSAEDVQAMAHDWFDLECSETSLPRIVQFVAAGFRAPVASGSSR